MQAAGGAALSADETLAAEPETVSAVPGGRARALAVFAAGVAVVLGADVVTKLIAVQRLSDRPAVRVLGGAVYFDLFRNSGAAFSMGTRYTFVFPVIAVLVSAWILWTARRLRSLPWAVAFALVLGGVLGNLTDRVFRAPGPFVGHVVDFISVFAPGGQVFPVFNVADSALCVGVGLAVLLELTGRRIDGGGARPDPAAVSDSERD